MILTLAFRLCLLVALIPADGHWEPALSLALDRAPLRLERT